MRAGSEPRGIAQGGEKLKTESFCRLFCGMDVQVGSRGELAEAPSVNDPESKKSELVIVANQVLPQEPGDGVEQFGTVYRGWRGFGWSNGHSRFCLRDRSSSR